MDNKRKLSFERASFLKVLKDDFTNKLPIPEAFTKTFEGEFPPWFILEIAGTRKCWRVDIEQDENGALYLGYGFDCFVEAHSLEMGNFLLFEHENPSILQVKIYEKDGSERKMEMTFRSEHQVGAASESLTQTPIIHQERNANPWPTSHAMTSVQFGAYKKQRGVIGIGMNNRKKCLVSTTGLRLRFSLTWKKANHFLYYLTIPRAVLVGKAFSNKETITLKDGEGNSWPIELRLRTDGRVDFARGWREFVNDNDLTTGDTLTFEFVANNVIQVHVRRAFQVNNPSQREQDGKIQPTENLNMACENEERWCAPSNSAPITVGKNETVACEMKSSFSFTWTDKTRKSYLHIPKAVANDQKLENKDIVVLCDPEGKQWLMEVRTRQSDSRVEIGRGWNDFIRSYGFKVGDTLKFEFVTDRMMKVQVIKACE